jgi:glycerol dehydrogenase
MRQTAIFPGRYVQQERALAALGEEVARLGSRALIVAGGTAIESILPESQKAWGEQFTASVERFGGECSDEEINRLTAIATVKRSPSASSPGCFLPIDPAR